MGATGTWYAVAVAATCAALVGSGSPARAGEEDPMVGKITALEAKVSEHTASKSLDGLRQDAADAFALYQENGTKDPHRERILKILGGLAKSRSDDVMKAAVGALANTRDASGVKYFKSFLRPIDEKTPVPPSLEAAIDAAKHVPDDSLVDPLLAIVDDSRNLAIAVKAMDALSKYGALKRSREHVLDALAKCVAKLQSGRKGYGAGAGGGGVGDPSGGGGGGGLDGGSSSGTGQVGPAERWQTLSAELPKTLNALTGQNETSAENWFELIKINKAKLSGLFRDSGGGGK